MNRRPNPGVYDLRTVDERVDRSDDPKTPQACILSDLPDPVSRPRMRHVISKIGRERMVSVARSHPVM